MGVDFLDKILIFTDGACSGNPGPGGFGTILLTPEGHVEELGEGRASTTNNRMEMVAVIKGLQKIGGLKGDVWVLSDSTYVIRGMTQWIWGWKKRGWVTSEGTGVSNKDLWKVLDKEIASRKKLGKIEWKYLRGHQGIPGNERCDEIAVEFSKKRHPTLFKGTLLDYSVPIHDLPEDMSLPPIEPQRKRKKAAYSYLSYVKGQLRRHATWSECEANVKGLSGAKFKKATSAEEEKKIVSEWGLDPSTLENLD